jgi:hypothetical protein
MNIFLHERQSFMHNNVWFNCIFLKINPIPRCLWNKSSLFIKQKKVLDNLAKYFLIQKCLAKYPSKLFCLRRFHKNIIFNELLMKI